MAELMPWDEKKMAVGVREIDTQHKNLVAMLNKLNAKMKDGKGGEAAREVLKELVSYTQKHFTTEETLMNKHSYPESPAHTSEHSKLLLQAADLETRLFAAKTNAIEIMMFLKNWLTDHIMKTDKKFGAFLNTKGVS